MTKVTDELLRCEALSDTRELKKILKVLSSQCASVSANLTLKFRMSPSTNIFKKTFCLGCQKLKTGTQRIY